MKPKFGSPANVVVVAHRTFPKLTQSVTDAKDFAIRKNNSR
jgi:hypothetical protein